MATVNWKCQDKFRKILYWYVGVLIINGNNYNIKISTLHSLIIFKKVYFIVVIKVPSKYSRLALP